MINVRILCFKDFQRQNTHGFLSTATIRILIWLPKNCALGVIIRRTKDWSNYDRRQHL